MTVYEDGTLEAECGAIPCGEVGRRCINDQTGCRADTDVFSGMRWAPNGQSVLLRCCTIKVPNKIYVGTDLVSAGSYYEGGIVSPKDMYYPKGREYDFIANVRTEQGGVRVWVYRVACGENDRRVDFEPVTFNQPTIPTSTADTCKTKNTTQRPQEFNPLRYRPANVQRSSARTRHS
ncbi:hypothetical protein KIN20_030903 [Parelaphostrongylus tenuis]|uniref:Uncharacterized protein n=1 Tax=Parelaphostrongylus tenuis TaxID=148309 RepID=A0AAD5R4F3_PARTN|nr:hypothetical protein KIN20_030903 [Parelaphostrongylus tenuis]